MKVTITFDFNSAEDAIGFLASCRAAPRVQVFSKEVVDKPQTGEPTKKEVTRTAPEVKPKKLKRGGKKKEEAEPKQVPDPQALLEKIVELKGFSMARDLLSRYGVGKLRDLPAEKVEEFCLHAAKVLDGASV